MHRKNRRPDFVQGGGFIMQGFADILPHSDTECPQPLGFPRDKGQTRDAEAVRSSRIAPRQENGTTKVVSFSFLKFFIFLLDK